MRLEYFYFQMVQGKVPGVSTTPQGIDPIPLVKSAALVVIIKTVNHSVSLIFTPNPAIHLIMSIPIYSSCTPIL